MTQVPQAGEDAAKARRSSWRNFGISSAILAFAIWDARLGEPAASAWPARYAVLALALAGCLITGIDLAPRQSTERKLLWGLSIAALAVAAAGLVMRSQG